MFNPQRLTIARERRAMRKKELAEAIRVTPNTILRYETGAITPAAGKFTRITNILDFPINFLYGNDIDKPERGTASFRGLARKSLKIIDSALALAALAYIFDDWVIKRYYRTKPDLLDLQNEDPIIAAQLIRHHWHISTKPIGNMVHLMETRGVRVFSLAENVKDIGSFSLWRGDIPYIFLNGFKSPENSRFDVAHELAHLCLHKHGRSAAHYANSPAEKEANAFAEEFLIPESDMRDICKKPINNIDDLLGYKKRWRVSATALNYRAHDIGLISESKCNSNYVEMSKCGWLKSEPFGISRETSYIWQKILDDIRIIGVTKIDIAHETDIPLQDIESLLFGLVNMLSIDGQGAKTPPRKVHLKVV